MTTTLEEQTTRAPHETTPAAAGGEGKGVREEAIASLKRKRRFAENFVGYITLNGVLWLIWALTDRSMDGSMPWPAWVSAVWGFFLAMDAWRAFGQWPRSLHRPITEADIEREIERSRHSSAV